MFLDILCKENVRYKKCGLKLFEFVLFIYNFLSMDFMVFNKFCVLFEDRVKVYWNRLKFVYIMLFFSLVM